ncbi:hypothetical protein QYF61_017427, partial [Mycteria americana]
MMLTLNIEEPTPSLRKAPTIGPLLDGVGHLTNKDEDKADTFNSFFTSVFNTSDALWDAWSPRLEDHDWGSDKVPDDFELVQDLLLQLNAHKTMGPDEIQPRLLKELADVIVRPLTVIYQQSWEPGEVLVNWKLANIIPIFKKGKKDDPGNYRPVSLTSVPGEIMEKIILGVIEKHLKDNTVIEQSQHLFMKGQDKGKTVGAGFLDFSKAFGTVSHSNLLDKMSSVQLDMYTIQLAEGPCSSVLLSDLDTGFEHTLNKCANNTELGGAVDSLKGREALQRDLDRLGLWAITSCTKFNKNKCQILHQGLCYPGYGGTRGWSAALQKGTWGFWLMGSSILAKRTNRILGCIKHSIANRWKEAIVPLYSTLVQPHLKYYEKFWPPQYKKDIKIFESVQRRATKMVQGLEGMTSEELLRILGLFSLEKRREWRWRSLPLVSGDKTQGNGFKLHQGKFILAITKKLFTERVVKHCNKLPREVVTAPGLSVFKQNLYNAPR